MAYNEQLAEKVRQLLPRKNVVEKKMMGGLTFMINNKMCAGILKDDLMVRIDPDIYESVLARKGAREMNFTGKPMKGFVFVGTEGTSNGQDLRYWVELALDFNGRAKASKKRR